MSKLDQAIEYARSNHDRYFSEFKEYLAIPSISTLSENKPDIRRAAEWLARQMTNMGLDHVEVMPTEGHPVVYGEWLGAVGKPTLLIYGHYDVQPVDPLNEWNSPPFEPTLRGDDIYARGASDMKGNGHATLKALEAWLKTGSLPVNIKVLFEGEEEIGSPSLGAFVAQHKDKLKCDLSLNVDGGILKPDLPSITIGLRGLCYFEIWVRGPAHDLHSGEFGGSVHNPAQVLCELVAGMHDEHGRVALPGFYDRVQVLSSEQRADLACQPHSDEEWRELTGVPALYGEEGYTTLERLGVRPTLEVNGLLSGFTGEGAKTVLPGKAMAKISMRLVPDQDPAEVEQQLNAYFKAHVPKTVTWEIKRMAGGPAILIERDGVGVRAAQKALQATFGAKPVFKMEGGSVPVVGMFKSILGVDSIILGFGLPEDNIHAPNEKYHLPNYYRGIEALIRFFEWMAQPI